MCHFYTFTCVVLCGSRLCVLGHHIHNSHRIVAVLPFCMCLCIISQYYLADIFMANLKFRQASKAWKTTQASLCHSTFTRLSSTQIYHSEKN
uniref:Putative secreted protein n=1 Tax=Ixodes ricinus TaxID=34613 RepID=A0A6B0UC86_IXORI